MRYAFNQYILLFSSFLILTSCNQKIDYFRAISVNDIPLSKPKTGDWLFHHKERPQTFDDFKNAYPLTPNNISNNICLQPIGNFNTLELQQIELTREYLSIFFQAKTLILKKLSNNVIPQKARRINLYTQEQALATYVRDTIVALQKPKDAIVIMGMCEMDLYPNPKWNFVFGLASYDKGLAVSSLNRLNQKPLNHSNFNLGLIRILKTSSHEIGHMFGLTHCIINDCLMNGTSGLKETDKSSIRLCSKCQQKLSYNLKLNNIKRLKDLRSFFIRNDLKNEFQILNKDYQALNLN